MSFDGQVVRRPSPRAAALLERCVPVRVTDMRGVDLARWRFDWDLTFAAVVAHPDGTIHHRYGGRDDRGADHWLTEASYVAFLEAGLATHHAYLRGATPAPELDPPLRIEEVPAFARKDKGECIHCHSVYPALHEEARKRGGWSLADVWVHPPPGRIGIDLDRDEQRRVLRVDEGSAAERAGVRVGDRLTRLGRVPLATASDLMAALDELPNAGARAPLVVERGDGEVTLDLALEAGWRVGTTEEFAWRPTKWGLTPAPGFGGPQLDAGDKRALGLAPDAFAFRIQYFVTWNENRRYGQAAGRAGLRSGDVVVGLKIDGEAKRDFAGQEHFHAWWRLTLRPGDDVEVLVLRAGEEQGLPIEVLP